MNTNTPIEFYVQEAQRLNLSADQVSVVGSPVDGAAFRAIIDNAQGKSDTEATTAFNQEWLRYTSASSGEGTGQGFDDDFDVGSLEINEDYLEKQAGGGGEVLEASNECEDGACKI